MTSSRMKIELKRAVNETLQAAVNDKTFLQANERQVDYCQGVIEACKGILILLDDYPD